MICSGTTIKTRKRNIAVPHDPSKFANAIVQLYTSHDGDLVSIPTRHEGAAEGVLLEDHDRCACRVAGCIGQRLIAGGWLPLQELVAKDVDSSELDFNRYGETFFEVRGPPIGACGCTTRELSPAWGKETG